MRELPIYNGVMPQAAQQRFVRVDAPKVEAQGHILDKAIEGAMKVGDKLVELHDLGVQNEVEHKLRENELAKQKEFKRRLELPPGTEGSFFLADGRENEDAMASFAHEWQEANRQVSGGFIRPDNMLRGQGRIDAVNDEVKGRVFLGVQARALANQKQAFEDNFAQASKMGEWAEAERIADAAGAAGQISRARANRLMFESRQNGYMQRVQEAWNGGAESFAALYDDPEFRAGLSEENEAKLDAMAARLPVDVPKRKVTRTVDSDGRVKLEAEAAQAPRGLPRALVGVWNEYKGDFAGVDAREAARKPLMEYLRGLVQHVDDPAELEQAKAVCKAYGHGAEFADSMVKQLRKEIDGTAVFNAREAMGQFTGRGLFFTPYNYDKVRALQQEHAGLAGRKRSKKEQVRFAQLNEDIKKWEGWEKSSSEGASRSILARFDDWLRAHPEATYREQARVFYGFVDSHSKDDAAVVDAVARADADAGVYDRKVARQLAERRAAGEALQADVAATEQERERMRELSAAAVVAADADARAEADEAAAREVAEVQLDGRRGVSRNWAGDAVRSILYVPKGHAMAGQTVKLSTPNDVCSYAEVVEHEGCAAPVMSQYLRRNLGVLHNPYGAISFDGYEGRLGAVRPAGGAVAKSLGGLAAYRDVFMDAAARNGLDPKLLMAIAMHETGRGTSSAFRNKKNAMGVSDANGPRVFASVEDSIYFMARQLKKNYLDKGLRTVEQIGAKYAPIGAGNDPRGLNRHWVDGVSRYMNELN